MHAFKLNDAFEESSIPFPSSAAQNFARPRNPVFLASAISKLLLDRAQYFGAKPLVVFGDFFEPRLGAYDDKAYWK